MHPRSGAYTPYICLSYAPIGVYGAGDCYRGFPRMSLLGDSVNSSSVLGELRPAWGQEKGQDDSLLALLSLLAAEGLHHRRRDIGVVVHNLPFSAFTPVDVRHPPLDAYRIVSALHLAMFSAHCVRYIVGYGKDN